MSQGPAGPGRAGGDLLGQADGVLLDFDGPVCRLFARLPAPVAAERLQAFVMSLGVDAAGPAEVGTDPLAVLRGVVRFGPDVVRAVDERLTQLETEAAGGAQPTPGAQPLLRGCHGRDVPVAIVSNNSGTAVRAYLDRLGLTPLIVDVLGRPVGRPDRMKPDPYLVDLALERLGLAAARAVLVGDSVTDLEAARARGVPSIGVANRPSKLMTLTRAGATVVVDDVRWLLAPDRDPRPGPGPPHAVPSSGQ